MPEYSQRSKDKLETCHPELQILFNEVIKHIDVTIISGYRSPEEQNKFFQQGRTTPGKIITFKDGYKKKSKHNVSPSLAVDIMPYPIDWDNIDRIKDLSSVIKKVYLMLYKSGKIKNKIVWGGDWKWKDYPHWQLNIKKE